MLIDAHTHIFPPAYRERREELSQRDPTFAELYRHPRAKLAVAGDVLESMGKAGIDKSVIVGFAWREPELCREQNEYLLEMAGRSQGKLIAFCTLPLADPSAARLEVVRCVRGGASGFGELRPESQSISLGEPGVTELLSWAAEAYDVPLLLHASEPVGHRYPGKEGQSLGALYEFVVDHPHVKVIAAHWGGGLLLYALMPEVKAALDNVYFDTAATSLLYEPAIFPTAVHLIGAKRILFGSDFPLLSQEGQVDVVRTAPIGEAVRAAILGENAAAVLGVHE